MKKGLIITILSLALSCNLDVLLGEEEYSFCISESKKENFFISEYSPFQRDFKINDTIYKIKEVWSENAWTYKNHNLDKDKLSSRLYMTQNPYGDGKASQRILELNNNFWVD